MPGGSVQQADFDRHPGGLQGGHAAAGDLGEGIAHGGHHAADAGGQDGGGAGRGLARVTAGLEGDIQGGPGGAAAGQAEGLHFGMIAAEAAMPAFADDLGAAGDDAADHGVGLDEPLAGGRQFQGPSHVPEVQFVGIHGDV